MVGNIRRRVFVVAAVLVGLGVFIPWVLGAPMGTAFQYQDVIGKAEAKALKNPCDLRFSLWDAATFGNQVGANQDKGALVLKKGAFSVTLDFGVGAFNGDARWIQLAYRSPAGVGNYVTLPNRRPIQVVQYVIYASNAGDADTLDGQHGAFYQNAGNLNAGTLNMARIADGAIAASKINRTGLDADLLDGFHVSDIVAGAGGWTLTGNSGTNPATNFIGTIDNKALEIKANNLRALRIEPNSTSPNMLGGYSGNTVTPGVHGAMIAGGGEAGAINSVTQNFGTVLGGHDNIVSGEYATAGGGAHHAASGYAATVGGGDTNTASGSRATVAGGDSNVASGTDSSVLGGYQNTAEGDYSTAGGGAHHVASGFAATVGGGGTNTASGSRATVAGGDTNVAGGDFATVPGGSSNVAAGDYTLSAGRRAKANHDGALVWADSTDVDFASTAANTFSARCVGGARFVTGVDGSGNPTAGVQIAAGGTGWSAVCDRAMKENFKPVDGVDILDRLAKMPVLTWNMKTQVPSIRHIGPVAQDFYAAFDMGEDDTHINSVDADGVALAAIQALQEKVKQQEAVIAALESRLAALEQAGTK